MTEIPEDFPVQPIAPDDPNAKAPTTCGTCGLTWDDAIPTQLTPVPSGRCPFEYFHKPCAVEDVYLGYSIDDDGVHLFCHRCTWDHNLGFNATTTDAVFATAAHVVKSTWPAATQTP